MQTVRVAVCEDDAAQRERILEYVDVLAGQLGLVASTREFSSGEELLFQYPEDLDILLLDIRMEGMDGIQTAREVRRADENVCIVFMTNYLQYAVDGYKVQAFRYLLKPVSFSQFKDEMVGAFLACVRRKSDAYCIANGGERTFVAPRDILYVEMTRRKACLFHLPDRILESYVPLARCERELGELADCFYRCHASYLINLDMVKVVRKTDVVMADGCTVPVSRQRKAGLVEAMAGHTLRSLS